MVKDFIIDYDDKILVTGAPGFIGSKIVETLINYGFKNLVCLARPSSDLERLNRCIDSSKEANIQIIKGNLLSRDDCKRATQKVSLIYHLAAGVEKSFAGCFMNSVVATRNLLDSVLDSGTLKRFLNVSSMAVYSNKDIGRGGTLYETSEVDKNSQNRYEAYPFGKIKQDEIVIEYSNKYALPYVIMRPGDVYGPGKRKISGKVGIDSFGFFLHLGGPNRIPLTYLDNCADAIVLGGIKRGVDGEVFNIFDDDLPTSRQFLKLYKKKVKKFKSIYVPYSIFYMLCYLWEKYSDWSRGQLPPAFNRNKCVANWKKLKYSNQKIKNMLGWNPKVQTSEGLRRYIEYMKAGQ